MTNDHDYNEDDVDIDDDEDNDDDDDNDGDNLMDSLACSAASGLSKCIESFKFEHNDNIERTIP